MRSFNVFRFWIDCELIQHLSANLQRTKRKKSEKTLDKTRLCVPQGSLMTDHWQDDCNQQVLKQDSSDVCMIKPVARLRFSIVCRKIWEIKADVRHRKSLASNYSEVEWKGIFTRVPQVQRTVFQVRSCADAINAMRNPPPAPAK